MPGPLDGVLVVDLTRALAGPHAGMMLGDLGARVIKVENPGSGDDTRGWGPPFLQPEGADRESTYFLSTNRNKESVTLDLKDDGDKELLRELVRRADVLLENFRPGTLARLGFGTEVLEQLNPRLVTLSISGFGHDGPEGGRAGYDQIAQGEGGLMSLTGAGPDDPQRVGVPIGDLLAGMYGAYGVLAALIERQRTGRGQVVRTSLLAAIVGVHAFQGTRWTVAGEVGRAQGNHHPSIAPYGLFHCRDGSVQLSCGSEGLWRRLCTEFGLDAEAPGLATNSERVANRAQVIELLERAFADHSPEELLARLADAGIPAGKVRTLDEVYTWDQTLSQGLLIDVEHATLGRLQLPGPPLRFFAPGPDGETETTRREHAAPPVLGSSDEAIRAWLAQ
ncbi:CaiB/BaiF CoA transferase family protein [Geodermatophilus obscurus]|uniref:L-carnitine dehydratase/bile acid-inducible protein F n=1 Tax=Geodermatophilus obscurus (strain ATCC 25078 / DSM 43160 / JCM 3152 / CCUG 61914 / KCC A-0152 / KCTC 9177 / NBRC 13315 / NRRL B-3577 / G-20) TaxID=526225 RepID=D2S8Z9_GEOOG|nr:CoA transferase [Geodermatophilus obscurus]ADB73642.1 L-carnitine dehydratase/bile acid-inducible protein F [Geodermatophilus obscurus DSM 43160]